MDFFIWSVFSGSAVVNKSTVLENIESWQLNLSELVRCDTNRLAQDLRGHKTFIVIVTWNLFTRPPEIDDHILQMLSDCYRYRVIQFLADNLFLVLILDWRSLFLRWRILNFTRNYLRCCAGLIKIQTSTSMNLLISMNLNSWNLWNSTIVTL